MKMNPLFRFACPLFALVLCLLLNACGERDQSRDIADFLERSRAYAQQGQFKAAIIESKNALGLKPDSIDAQVSLAEIYSTLNYTFAIIQLLEPVKDNPDPRVKLTLARAYMTKGKLHSAGALLAQMPGQLTPEQTRDVNLLKAEIAMQEQNLAEAQQILSAMPNDEKAILLLAQIDVLQQQLPQANARLEPLSKAGNFDAQELQARIAANSSQLEKAEELLTNLLIALPKTDILTPQRANVLRELMQVVTLQGRSNEALAYAKILADSAPEQAQAEDKLRDAIEKYSKGDLKASKKLLTELHNSSVNKEFTGQFLGVVNFMQGDTETAEQMLSKYLDLETASSTTLHMLAISQLNQNKPKELIKLLESDRSKFEKDAVLTAFYGIALLMDGQRAQGMKSLQRSIELDGKQVYAPLALARAYLLQHDKAAALQVLNDALKQNPSSKDLQSAIVGVHMQSKDPESALRFIDTQLAAQPNSTSLLLLGGLTQLAVGATDKAQAQLQKVIALEPKNPAATRALGQIALRQQQWDKAREQFTHLIEIAPNNPAGYEGLLATFAAQGRTQDGLAALEELARNSDASGLPFAVLARQQLAEGDTKRADEYAEQAFKNSHDDKYVAATFVTVLTTLARRELAGKEFDAARLHVVRALELAPKNVRLLSLLAEVELKAGNTKEAQKIAENLEQEQPGNSWSKLINGDAAAKDGKTAEALTLYRSAWETDKTDVAGSRIYAQMRASGGDTKAFLQEWLTARPNSTNALLLLAMEQTEKEPDNAIKTYEKLLSINSNSVVALNNLAWIYQERSDPRAMATAERAYNIAGNDSAVADTYGWMLVKNGKTREGIAVLEKALQLAPDSIDIKNHLEQAKKIK